MSLVRMLQLNTSLVRVLFPKPLPIGAQRDSCVQSKKNMAYRLCPSDRGDAAMVCERVPGGILYAEQASALVLKRLLDAVEQETGVRPDRAVISVPAYFKEAQQEATINAGALGLCALRESSRAIPLDQAPDSPSACLNTPAPFSIAFVGPNHSPNHNRCKVTRHQVVLAAPWRSVDVCCYALQRDCVVC
jgi:hypothetical protein